MSTNDNAQSNGHGTRRRKGAAWILALALAESSLALGRAADGWTDAQWYSEAGVPFSPHVYASLNLAWALLLLMAVYGMLRRKRWARRACWAAMPGYAIFSLAWMATFARSDYAVQRLPFTGVLTFTYCAAITWLLLRAARAEMKMRQGTGAANKAAHLSECSDGEDS